MNQTQSKRDTQLHDALRVTPLEHKSDHAEAGTPLSRLIAALLEPTARAQQRRELAELSERALHDFGLPRAQVVTETSKPLWRQERVMDDPDETSPRLDDSDFDERDLYQLNDIGLALRLSALRDFAEV